jgi:mRNA interferase RelE/StbE
MVARNYQYRLKFEEVALQAIESLPKNLRRQVGYSIDQMQYDWSGDIKKLKGYDHQYRLRVGRLRILFELAASTIIIYAVKDRKDAYER